MLRTAAVYSLPAFLIAISWLRLEDPQAVGFDAWGVLALALAPALAPTLVLRLALTVPASLTALWVAFDTPAPDDKPGFFVPVAERFADGMNSFFNVALPFSGIERMKMHGVVVLAIFGFCLVLAHAIAARRPLVAVLAVVAGAGWAATLYPSRDVLYGALILAGALWVLAGLRTTRPIPALLAGAALILVAAAASTSAAVAKNGVISWEGWDPSRGFGGAISVNYVWDAQYGGIQFSKKERTVLRITGPKRGLYWRATTLDQFDSDRWLDNPIPLSTGLATGRLPNDPLLADPLAGPEHLGEAGGEGRSAPRPAHHRRGAAGRARRARVGRCLPSLGRGRARLRRPQARPDVHRLQLCATPGAG